MTLPVSAEASAPAARSGRPRRRTVTLARTLAVAIGGLVAIAVAAVLAIYWTTAARTTFDLLTNQAEIGVASVEAQLRQHLEPVSNELGSLALLLQQGRLDAGNMDQFSTMLTGALAASPQVRSIAYLTDDLRIRGVTHQQDGNYETFNEQNEAEQSREALAEAAGKVDAYWGEILYLKDGPHATVMNLRQPVRRDGKLVGVLFAVVTVQDLSKFLARVSSDPSQVPFILYGEDRVLAHPRMATDPPPASVEEPLPRLDQVGDQLLAALWTKGSPVTVRNPRVRIREVQIGDQDEIFLYRTIYGFGPTQLILGIHVPGDAIGAEVWRVIRAGLAGLAVMVLAIIVGVFVGRMIARPVRAFSDQARAVGTLEFSQLKPLPGSVFKELNEGAQAFNTMLVGLRWLETYVPKSLVRRLITKGDGEDVVSIERVMTVMFTDIANFSAAAERLPAARIAAYLNEHFAMLARCVEAESGTIDKFIGDCLMAFWGAPEKLKDHAPRAARAALAIAAVMQAENDRRTVAGRPRLKLRIGLHSGPVVVGNIGAPGRTSYTIVGDTVNIGNRLEQLGKVLSRDEETTILISAETAALLGPEFETESLGPRRVRGRNGEVEIFRLVGIKPTA
ncbi:MAG: adenylate/guanylate cyclase domain-containing protein [Inquilinus sp.]|uniref:adenylate/guanylate cyclase domain-containing protein n=1 Tax=Inquilinus sp. TaxID=1932117 RepID=UPI003F355D1D